LVAFVEFKVVEAAAIVVEDCASIN
jgi:hypothetical protein